MTTTTTYPLIEQTFRHLGDGEYQSTWRNLYFTKAGWARVWAIIGYCQAAIELGDERGERLLDELNSKLNYLNQYGGAWNDTNLPTYRVVVGDDGCWGSFSLSWYNAISTQDVLKWASANGKQWSDALDSLRVCQDLKMWNGAQGYVYYRYGFNGGLILHWDKSPLDGSYGVHT